MEISKPIVGAVAALCLVAGAGTVYVLRSDHAAAPDSTAASAPGVETSEAVVTAPPAVDTSAPPAPAAPTVARSTSEPRVPAAARRPAPRPSSTPATASAAPSPAIESARAPEATRDDRPALPPMPEPAAAAAPAPAAPPVPLFEELVVSADSVIGLEVETSVSSERARVEDEVVAQVTRDVRVGNRVAIPSGAKAHGEVTFVERGGRMKDRARLGVRFTSIVLADGTRVPIDTDTIVREGSSPTAESSAKIGGGALGGAIIGGILGGAKGAIIGGSAGAGAGTAAVMAGGRNPATLSSGTPITVRLAKPTTVTVEK